MPDDEFYRSLLKDLADAKVIIDSAMPKDRIYIVPSSPEWYRPLPLRFREDLEPRWEAVAIVQDGMAEIVAWLRAAGHDMPDAWVQQADAHYERRKGMLYDAAMPSGPIIDPRSFVTITGI